MKTLKNKFLATMLLGFALSTSYAQDTTNTSGGNALGNGGSMAYSFGQVVYTTYKGTGGSVNQGVQQSFEIFTVGIKETLMNISLTIFPNPTANNLTLQIEEFTNEELTYQLFDMQGKLLQSKQVAGIQTEINTSTLQSATYLLNVFHKNKKVQSFKIIKK